MPVCRWSMILKLMLEKWDVKVWTGFKCLGKGFGASLCWHDNGTIKFHKIGHFFTNVMTLCKPLQHRVC